MWLLLEEQYVIGQRMIYAHSNGLQPDLHLGIDYNTSGMIRDILPRQIVRSGKPTITIIKYPDDTLCIYLWMIEAVKKILSGDRALYQGQVPDGDTPFTPDLILHLGMTDSPFFEFYEFARKDGYLEPGEDGVYYPQELLVKGGEWSELPDKLFTMIDMNQMRDKVLQKLPVCQTPQGFAAVADTHIIVERKHSGL